MKHINTYTENVNEWVSNLSKTRKFPTYRETHDKKEISKHYADTTDFYFIYSLNKHDIGKYLNTWFQGIHTEYKEYVTNDEMWTVKKVDEDTSLHLYNRYYNPVELNITCPIGAKFTKNEKGQDLYNMSAKILSIDDSSYSIYFQQKPYTELEEIRTNIMKWLNTQSILNGDEFLDYCISVGADPNSIDHD